jgi:hypothetical protein
MTMGVSEAKALPGSLPLLWVCIGEDILLLC